jgi:pSer/pThr/pTyr-binding forkhead associated (FHA) protein
MPAAIAKLVATESPLAPHEIRLTCFPVRVGRRVGNDVCLADRWVSRDHCEICCEAACLMVRDLGSKHGTFVNGRPVDVAPLHPGDELSVGLSRFRVQYEAESVGAELVHEAIR